MINQLRHIPDEEEWTVLLLELGMDPDCTPDCNCNCEWQWLGESEFVGSPLMVKVLEVNRSRNRAIFSERSALREQREAQKAALIEELHEGEIRKGRVTGISNFGAFVDLGGADGLIHISELSWGMVNSPEEIVTVGQELDVYVLRVDRDSMKIALSLRRMQPEPWDTIYDRYQVGDVVAATVT